MYMITVEKGWDQGYVPECDPILDSLGKEQEQNLNMKQDNSLTRIKPYQNGYCITYPLSKWVMC